MTEHVEKSQAILEEDSGNFNSSNFLENDNFEFLKLQYQVLSDRRINHNSLLWSTPTLLFVALTLLWSASLNNDVNIIIRCFVSVISVIVGVIALQSFERHRLMEIADAEQLYDIECMLEHSGFRLLKIHHTIKKRTLLFNGKDLEDNLEHILSKHSLSKSFKWWRNMFIISVCFSTLIMGYNIWLSISHFI